MARQMLDAGRLVACTGKLGGPVVLHMQYTQVLGVFPALEPTKQTNFQIIGVLVDFVHTDEREYIVVVADDDPSELVVERHGSEVCER